MCAGPTNPEDGNIDSEVPISPDNNEWELKAYEQGSEACRNYSRLTMRVRTLAQHLIAISVVGFAAIYGTDIGSHNEFKILIFSGIMILILTVSLSFVDWHYQTAFTAIRNCLAGLEKEKKIYGPWQHHLSVRTSWKDHIASYVPFLLLGLSGCLILYYGIVDKKIALCVSGFIAVILILSFILISMCTHCKQRKIDEIIKCVSPYEI